MKVRAIFLESSSLNVLGDVLDRMAWVYHSPTPFKIQTLIDQASKVMRANAQILAKETEPRAGYTGFLDVLNSCNKFIDSAGADHGDPGEWGTDTVLVIDGLTGLTKMAFQAVTGQRISRTLPEYGLVQANIRNFLEFLNENLKCHVVVTCHVGLSTDQVIGSTIFLPDTAGNKLGPTLPNTYSDYILANYHSGEFFWSTASPNARLKTINLPVGQDKLKPTFVPLIEGWKKRGGATTGAKVLLAGFPGAGKTHSIRTLLDIE